MAIPMPTPLAVKYICKWKKYDFGFEFNVKMIELMDIYTEFHNKIDVAICKKVDGPLMNPDLYR